MNSIYFLFLFYCFLSILLYQLIPKYHKISIIYNFATKKTRRQGLMFIKDSLPINTGALFVYDKYQYNIFWMKNTYISLDILLLDSNYKILCIHTNTKPLDLKKLHCNYRNIYAVETNAGFVKQNNIKIGDYLILDNS